MLLRLVPALILRVLRRGAGDLRIVDFNAGIFGLDDRALRVFERHAPHQQRHEHLAQRRDQEHCTRDIGDKSRKEQQRPRNQQAQAVKDFEQRVFAVKNGVAEGVERAQPLNFDDHQPDKGGQQREEDAVPDADLIAEIYKGDDLQKRDAD